MTVSKLPRHHTVTGVPVAGIYVRISDDKEGRELGVERQIADCQKHAQSLGVTVHRIYRDNDIGASTRSSKPRPEYNQLLADAKSGTITMIIAYTSGRLTRRPLQLEGQIELAEKYGTRYRYIKSPSFDLNTAAGRMVARILAATDAAEAEEIGERVARARLQQAQQGKFGGGTRPYGFGVQTGTVEHKNRKTGVRETVPVYDCSLIVEAEADEIRKVADQILTGVPLRSIVRDLNERGVTAAKGGKWLPIMVRDMLLRPRNAGILVNDGEEVGHLTGESILTEDVWRAVVDKLNEPTVTYADAKGRKVTVARVTHIKGGPAHRWLGSGIYRCGICEGPMRVHGASSHKDAPTYRCQKGSHVGRIAMPLDDHIAAKVIARMSLPDAADLAVTFTVAPGVDVNALRAERKTIRELRDALGEAFIDGTATKAQLAAGNARAEVKLAAIEVALAGTVNTSPLTPLIGVEDVAEAWENLSLGQQRAVVDELMIITVLPAPRGKGFDPQYIEIVWR